MFQQMKKRMKNEKGLTLIELLAVIVILAIVAAIAVPAIGNIIDNSRYNAVKADAVNVLNAANIYYTDNPEEKKAVSVKTLIDNDYLDAAGKIPTTSTVSPDNPRALTATVPDVVGTHDVKFLGATIDMINADDTKGGSLEADKEIKPTS